MSQLQTEISLKFQPVREANPSWSVSFFYHLPVKAGPDRYILH